MADSDKDLGLGVMFTASMGDFTSQLEAVKTKLKELAKELESLSSKGTKSATSLAKAQEKVAEATKKAAEVSKTAGKDMAASSEAAVSSSERLADSTSKTNESLKRWGRSAAEVSTELKGLDASTRSQITASNLSLPVYESLASKMQKAAGASLEYKKALAGAALESKNNLLKFNDLAKTLQNNEVWLTRTEQGFKAIRAQLGANALPKDYDNWASGVDRLKLAHATLNGELYKSGNVIINTKAPFADFQRTISSLKTSYGEAAWASTDMGNRLGSYVKTVGAAKAELANYVKEQSNVTKFTTAANEAIKSASTYYEAAGKSGANWAAGVDKASVATSFVKGQLASANGAVLEMGKSFTQTSQEIESVEKGFTKLGSGTIENLRSQLGKGITTWDSYRTALTKATERAENARTGIDNLNTVHKELSKVVGLSAAAQDKLATAVKNGGLSVNQAVTAGKTLAATQQGMADNAKLLSSRYAALVSDTEQLGESARNLISRMGPLKTDFATTNDRLKELNSTFNKGLRETNSYNSAVAKLGVQTPKTAAFISDLTTKLKNKEITLSQATAEVKKYSSAMETAGKQVQTTTGFFANLTSKLQGGGAAARAATDYFSRLGQAVGSLAAWIPAALVIGGFTQAIASAVEAVKDYDQALKSLQAISGGTEAEISVLGKAILDISDNTKYAASELTQGAIYIAQAGFTASESLEVVAAAAKGAQGTLEPLTTAADLLTTVLRAFHIDASEASSVMDTLAVAANKSKTDLEGMRVVFNYLGPAAYAAGASLNETLGAVMALSNVGMRMSTVGTSMRQVLIGLENPSKKLRTALDEAGMSVEDLSIRKMGGLIPVLKNLNTLVGGDLSNAVQFFNVRAGNAALVISQMNAHVEMMIEYTKEYGAAAVMASTQSEGMTVQLAKLGNQFQNLLIRLSEGGPTDAFKALISILKEVMNILDALASNTLVQFLATWAIFTTAIKTAIGLFGSLSIKFATISGVAAEAALVAQKTVGSWNLLIASLTRLLNIAPSVPIVIGGINKSIAVYDARLAGATLATRVFSKAWTALTTLLLSNPFTLLIAGLGFAAAAVYSFTTKSAEQSKVLQENVVIYEKNSTSASRLAGVLRDINANFGEGATATDSYASAMKEISTLFPEVTAEIVKNRTSLEEQAKVLDQVAIRYKQMADDSARAAVANLGDEFVKSAGKIEAYNEIVMQGRSWITQLGVAIGSVDDLVINLGASMLGNSNATKEAAKSWANISAVWSSFTSAGMVNEAAKKLNETVAYQIELIPELKSVIMSSSKDIRESLISSIPNEQVKAKVKELVKEQEAYIASMKAGTTELEQSQITAVGRMGNVWLDYYDKQNDAGKAAVTMAAENAGKQMDAVNKQYKKGELNNEQYHAQLEKIQLDSFNKLIANQTKYTEDVLKLEDKLYEDEHSKRKAALEQNLTMLDLAQKQEIVNLGNMGLATADYLTQKETIESAYYTRNKTAIDANTQAELDALQKTYNAKVEQVTNSQSLYATEETFRSRIVALEVENASKLATIYSEQLATYKTHIGEKITEYNKYKSTYEKALADIEAAEKAHLKNIEDATKAYHKAIADAELTYSKNVEDIERLKRDARQLTMTEREKLADREQELNETLAKGYALLAEAEKESDSAAKKAKIKAAQDYFNSAKGLAGNIASETKAADSTVIISAETARDKRIAALAQVETAYGSLRTAMEGVAEDDKNAAIEASKQKRDALVNDLNAIAEAAKANMQAVADTINTLMTKYAEVVELFNKAIEVKLNTETTYTELNNLKTYIKKAQTDGEYNVVIPFKGSASPEDTLENTIKTVKGYLNDLVTYMADSLKPIFTIIFKGEDSGTTSGLSTMIASVESKMQALSSKINSLKTVHTITTKYVTEGSSESESSSSDTSGYAEGGVIPGVGNTDSVLGALTPGEFVIKKSVVSALGTGFFNMINSMKSFHVPKFAKGGMIPAIAGSNVVRSKIDETFTINLQAGSAKLPLQVVGSPSSMRGTIRQFEKELGRMRLSHG